MAIGDALAVALSQKKQFGRQEFALFHPRGTLGKQLLLTVGKIANNDLEQIAIYANDEIKKVLWIITKNRLGAVSVIDKNGKLIGLVSDGDIRRAIEKSNDIWTMTASDIMTANPINVKDETLVVDAFKIMQGKKISVLPITNENDILTGLVSFYDIVESGIVGGK
jgi:arabinose-5-phosphate isomerase